MKKLLLTVLLSSFMAISFAQRMDWSFVPSSGFHFGENNCICTNDTISVSFTLRDEYFVDLTIKNKLNSRIAIIWNESTLNADEESRIVFAETRRIFINQPIQDSYISPNSEIRETVTSEQIGNQDYGIFCLYNYSYLKKEYKKIKQPQSNYFSITLVYKVGEEKKVCYLRIKCTYYGKIKGDK
jgi:hypothetical protein